MIQTLPGTVLENPVQATEPSLPRACCDPGAWLGPADRQPFPSTCPEPPSEQPATQCKQQSHKPGVGSSSPPEQDPFPYQLPCSGLPAPLMARVRVLELVWTTLRLA